mmetsp:Transcript_133842/g.325264  ORF Transcript_133842/g.325264 Transcript_133842/m.325264 type:complete len:224 (-) Transcript_133842:257-928(-)
MYLGNRLKAMREAIGISLGSGKDLLISPRVGGGGQKSAPTGKCFRCEWAFDLHSLNSCRKARIEIESPSGPCICAKLSNVTLKTCAGSTFVASNRTSLPSLRALPTSEGSTIGSCDGRPSSSNEACIRNQSTSMPPACASTWRVRFSRSGPCGACARGGDSKRSLRCSLFLSADTGKAAAPLLASVIAGDRTLCGSGLSNSASTRVLCSPSSSANTLLQDSTQ